VIKNTNDENMGFEEAVTYIVTKLPRAGKLIAMHILSLLVLGGLVVDRTFLTNAMLANVCTKKVSCCLFVFAFTIITYLISCAFFPAKTNQGKFIDHCVCF